MTYDVADIMRDIRITLDMNNSSEALLDVDDIDALTLDELIRKKLPVAARIVHTKAPRYLLDSGRAFGETIGWIGSVGIGCGVIHLPDDFMRLVSFQMSDWDYPVVEAITEESPEYAKLHSRFPGLSGCPQRPVVAITQQPVGQVLEFYSCTAGSSVTLRRARYIPYPKIKNNGIELCEKLYDATVHYTAYLVALSMRATELANALLSISENLMI